MLLRIIFRNFVEALISKQPVYQILYSYAEFEKLLVFALITITNTITTTIIPVQIIVIQLQLQ